ncbi:SRPBCC family protein [Pedobacter nanyangensis]|uniref:SRPBCC family protein n=1 Tax=Pedobacter nanyangensis TaxID=1562389 RepID=UPI000DE216A3|nr:SRPBCC family protein [Pedobacter nanyangensis]
MKFLKIFLAIVIVLIAIFFVGGTLLPKTYSVHRSIDIAAKDSVVYKNIADFNNFLQWNAWSKMDSTTKYNVTGTPEQVGHQYHWAGKKMGEGEMKITAVKPLEQIKMDLKFIKPFESLANVAFDLAKEGDGTKVTWTMSGEHNIISKWMCVFNSMDSMIGKDFEEGLKALKEKSEQK